MLNNENTVNRCRRANTTHQAISYVENYDRRACSACYPLEVNSTAVDNVLGNNSSQKHEALRQCAGHTRLLLS